ncbi:Glutamate--cysteine ligase [uncultured Candidatus Thioglobus sp.]|nr:Glutamate--cysteine ligase [uncultured Candidatus Thioglobus sp.]
MGIEKEGLRISRKGGLSQAPHPDSLGCALTHPNITTDFSESLLELVTPPLSSAKEVLDFLQDTQHYLYCRLPKDQNFWPASMPCVIRGETFIPIAQYGSSNRGKMKTVYRQGLANRYGSVMQTIAGIHFNYSISQDFIEKACRLTLIGQSKDEAYMALTRNVVRYGWIIPYLFGASPAVCKSFLKGYHQHSLIEFNKSTLYEPYATSLRMGDIGYQNLREDEAGVKANYNSLSYYVHSLKAGMAASCSEYEKIGIKKNGKYQQLNANILQIENEYYASVRPKPIIKSGQKPLDSLSDDGIAYIELRSLDLNPSLPMGIDEPQIHFLEVFLLFCLLKNSPAISTREQVEIDNNDQLVAHEGRKPGLMLKYQLSEISIAELGSELTTELHLCAGLFGDAYIKDVSNIARRFDNPELTPSAQTLTRMKNKNQGFFDDTNAFAKQYRREFLSNDINQVHFNYLDEQVQQSCKSQQAIEESDTMSFDQYLTQYFEQV